MSDTDTLYVTIDLRPDLAISVRLGCSTSPVRGYVPLYGIGTDGKYVARWDRAWAAMIRGVVAYRVGDPANPDWRFVFDAWDELDDFSEEEVERMGRIICEGEL